MRLSLVVLLGCIGCAEAPPPPPARWPPEPTRDTSPPPPPPPRPLTNDDAHYIITMPAPASAPGAKICASTEACNALIPKDHPYIVQRFSEESWVVINVPADHAVASVKSDGAAATVTLARPCPGKTERVEVWRVAPTVKTATIAPAFSSKCEKD